MDAQLSNEAVENLVTQFSSALDFFRELVQNSIDAGTSSVDVWMEYLPGEGSDGVVEIHVDDFGEGMNEEIIDQQLTQLFSSSKENDLTKIGKFGIGFVSVFALEPKGVLIHTGRDGEFWEVFFHQDRSFTKTRIETPIEGTQITLFLPGDRARYRELVRGSRKALGKWCSHSDTDVSFEDRSPSEGGDHGTEAVNRPFVAPGECAVRVEHPGTELSLAYAESPSYGFYNRGLALAVAEVPDDLLDNRADRYRHISMKIKSRYLEHTLSRETVMRDEHYEKAMSFLDLAANGPLRASLAQTLTEAAAESAWDLAAADRYRRLASFLAAEPRECLPDLASAKLLRTVDGTAISLSDIDRAVRRDGWIYISTSPSSLTTSLHGSGVPVLLSLAGHAETDPVAQIVTNFLYVLRSGGLLGLVRKTMGADHYAEASAKLVAPEKALVEVTVDRSAPSPVAELIDGASALLSAVDAGYRELRTGQIVGSPNRPRLFALGRQFGSLMAIPPGGVYSRGFMERPRALVNRMHPHFRWLLDLQRTEPELAMYCLAKSLILEEDRGLEKDYQLLELTTAGLRGRA